MVDLMVCGGKGRGRGVGVLEGHLMVCRWKGGIRQCKHDKWIDVELTMSRVMTQTRGPWRSTALWGFVVHQHGQS